MIVEQLDTQEEETPAVSTPNLATETVFTYMSPVPGISPVPSGTRKPTLTEVVAARDQEERRRSQERAPSTPAPLPTRPLADISWEEEVGTHPPTLSAQYGKEGLKKTKEEVKEAQILKMGRDELVENLRANARKLRLQLPLGPSADPRVIRATETHQDVSLLRHFHTFADQPNDKTNDTV